MSKHSPTPKNPALECKIMLFQIRPTLCLQYHSITSTVWCLTKLQNTGIVDKFSCASSWWTYSFPKCRHLEHQVPCSCCSQPALLNEPGLQQPKGWFTTAWAVLTLRAVTSCKRMGKVTNSSDIFRRTDPCNVVFLGLWCCWPKRDIPYNCSET